MGEVGERIKTSPKGPSKIRLPDQDPEPVREKLRSNIIEATEAHRRAIRGLKSDTSWTQQEYEGDNREHDTH